MIFKLKTNLFTFSRHCPFNLNIEVQPRQNHYSVYIEPPPPPPVYLELNRLYVNTVNKVSLHERPSCDLYFQRV
jgi:hypothetical protein